MDENNFVDSVMRYESGEMSFQEIVVFFQEMIDSGAVWSLQGSYQRMASDLIAEGYCYE